MPPLQVSLGAGTVSFTQTAGVSVATIPGLGVNTAQESANRWPEWAVADQADYVIGRTADCLVRVICAGRERPGIHRSSDQGNNHQRQEKRN